MGSRKETLSPPKIASDPSGVNGFDKSGVWEIGENPGANAMADENPVNDYRKRSLHRIFGAG